MRPNLALVRFKSAFSYVKRSIMIPHLSFIVGVDLASMPYGACLPVANKFY
ncbi:hypothetical protein VCRA2121O157_100045 [Vibrio crassostreae]|nr:hypothetical protein VCHA28O22_150046 [Vibrio chagasii]CAK1703809.1 hypothetical protein VCRA2113O140_100121 [Vibrio crassostreae]CAH6826952.1 hypothetical protein VCHA32O87_150117 [Vibrio chagasii]CAH6968172.1 hypothetical protein VCHA43P284_130048 [Vibrio chagasii]CAH7030615.1 hypothetical protein VCHA43P273_10047 [Vibrio chagasii]